MTKKFALVKLDGIGDYLFFRLFWPQLFQLAQEQQAELYFCCSESVLPLAVTYDSYYLKGVVSGRELAKYAKDKYLLFLPRRYFRWKRSRIEREMMREADMVVNMQTSRGLAAEQVIDMIKSPYKVSVCNCNLREASRKTYQDTIYHALMDVSLNQFILSYYQKYLEQVFHSPFTMPACRLPFSQSDILNTVSRLPIHEGGGYILFVPFSSDPTRNWAMEKFVLLAKKLSLHLSLPIVIVGQCLPETKQLWKDLPQVVDLTNQTSLITALQVAAGAKYAVCVDTSLMHAALWGGAETIVISNGMSENLFVRYPKYCAVKQTVFMPPERSAQGIGDIQQIDEQCVWQHIEQHWK